jgi:hypothetical protein
VSNAAGLITTATAIDGSITTVAFIFNGPYRNILEFNLDSEKVKIIRYLPFEYGKLESTAILSGGVSDEIVYIFAGYSERPTNVLLQFNTTSKLTTIPMRKTTLGIPTLCLKPASVSGSGQNQFIIGALGRIPEIDGSRFSLNGILR